MLYYKKPTARGTALGTRGPDAWCADTPSVSCGCQYDGMHGEGCESRHEAFCLNQCSGHGRCDNHGDYCHSNPSPNPKPKHKPTPKPNHGDFCQSSPSLSLSLSLPLSLSLSLSLTLTRRLLSLRAGLLRRRLLDAHPGQPYPYPS